MADETEDDVSGWTLDTLRAYLVELLREMDLRHRQRSDGLQEQLTTVPPVAQLIGQLTVRVDGFGELMESKFVTYRTLIDSQAEKVALALDSAEKAIDKAEKATEKRFDAVENFRKQLGDQAVTFARHDFVEEKIDGMDRRLIDSGKQREQVVAELRAVIEKLVTKDTLDAFAQSSQSDRSGLHDRVAALESRMDVQAGKQEGGTSKVTDQRAFIASAIGAVGLLITVVVVVANILSARGG